MRRMIVRGLLVRMSVSSLAWTVLWDGQGSQFPFLLHLQITGREARKLNDKQRKLEETAVRNKLDALRDDDNVFDVSYERQGGGAEDTVSATDIKVCPALNTLTREP